MHREAMFGVISRQHKATADGERKQNSSMRASKTFHQREFMACLLNCDNAIDR